MISVGSGQTATHGGFDVLSAALYEAVASSTKPGKQDVLAIPQTAQDSLEAEVSSTPRGFSQHMTKNDLFNVRERCCGGELGFGVFGVVPNDAGMSRRYFELVKKTCKDLGTSVFLKCLNPFSGTELLVGDNTSCELFQSQASTITPLHVDHQNGECVGTVGAITGLGTALVKTIIVFPLKVKHASTSRRVVAPQEPVFQFLVDRYRQASSHAVPPVLVNPLANSWKQDGGRTNFFNPAVQQDLRDQHIAFNVHQLCVGDIYYIPPGVPHSVYTHKGVPHSVLAAQVALKEQEKEKEQEQDQEQQAEQQQEVAEAQEKENEQEQEQQAEQQGEAEARSSRGERKRRRSSSGSLVGLPRAQRNKKTNVPAAYTPPKGSTDTFVFVEELGLLLGEKAALKDPALWAHPVTHVFSLVKKSEGDQKIQREHPKVTFTSKAQPDGLNFDAGVAFADILAAYEVWEAAKANGLFFVHCEKGKSRSVGAVIMLLAWFRNRGSGGVCVGAAGGLQAAREAVQNLRRKGSMADGVWWKVNKFWGEQERLGGK